MIHIKGLSYQYPGAREETLQGIDLSIEKGALLGLIGPNGAGKTTLISILTGVLKHDKGTVTIAGHCLPKNLKQAKQLIGYIPQDYAFYPNLSAFENLQFFAGVQAIPSSKKTERIDFCLEFCQLKNVANQRASEFSGGLKRRLNIAIGLLTDPDILFFDEPTVSIDPQSRAFILQQIKALQEHGKTIIYTSHYMEEVEQLCDYLAIIDHGKLLKQGTLHSLQKEEKQQLIIETEDTISSNLAEELHNRFDVSIKQKQLVFHNVHNMTTYLDIINQIQEMTIPVSTVFFGKHNLEQLFLELTSKQLRD